MRHLSRKSRAGFTLLEVLLALAVGGILLGVVWTGLDMFWKYSEAGRETSDQLQVARAVFLALQRDLRSASQPDEAATTTSTSQTPTTTSAQSSGTGTGGNTSTSSSTTGSTSTTDSTTTATTPTTPVPPLLVGDSQSLIFQGVIPQPLEHASQVAQMTGGVTPPRRDLQWIGWSITGKLPSNLATAAPVPPPPVPDQTDGVLPLLRWQNDLAGDSTALGPTAASILPVPPEPVPEVRRFLLHYYDGVKWYDTWDSDLMAGLPIAIEVEIEISSAAALDLSRQQARNYRPTNIQTRTFKTVIPFPLKTSARQYPESS
ncbi:MAG: prepilin-type N-terminal cleavage/methylation domain-containing protein [Planctomycetales bacterium]